MHLRSQALDLVLSPARTVDAEDWVRVRAKVDNRAFVGEFEAYLQLQDLRRFEQEIRRMYSEAGMPQEAVLSSFEPGIYVRLVSQKLGGVVGTYRLQPERSLEEAAELSGVFCSDQSYLPELAASIENLVVALAQNDA